jgi:hypothetical protein
MKAVIITLFLVLTIASNTEAQIAELWRKSYIQEIESSVKSYARDNAGNFIIGASVGRNIPIGANYVILKFNPEGDTLWRREYHSVDGTHDHLWDVYVDGSGNIYATGLSTDYSTPSTLRTVKYSPAGTLLWQRTDTVEAKQQNNGISKEACIKEGPDGSIYILTNRLGFLCLLKYNPNGTLIYDRDIDLPQNIAYMYARGLEVNSHGLILSSEFVDNVNYQYHQLGLKCSFSGDTAWTWYERFGNTFWEGPASLIIDAGGNSYFLTQLMQNFYTSKMVVTKVNPAGGILWTKTHGTGIDNYRVIPRDIKLDNAGNVIVAADNTYHLIGSIQYFETIAIKYSSVGDLLWTKNIRSAEINDLTPRSILVAPDNSIYVSGECPMQTSSSQFIQKFTPQGDSVWNFNIQGVNYWSIGRFASIDNAGNVFLASERQNGIMLTKFGVPIGIQNINSEIPGSFSLSQNYPNPFNPVTNIEFAVPKAGFVKLAVYDITGKEIETLAAGQISAGTYKADWNASGRASGIYFYRLEAQDYAETKKMILVK